MNFLFNHPPVFLGFLLASAIVVVLFDSFISDAYNTLGYKHNIIFVIATASLSIVLMWIGQLHTTTQQFFLHKHFLWDPLAALLATFIVLIVILVFLYAYVELTQYPAMMIDYYLLGLLSTFGMLVVVCSGSMFTIYLGLEIMSLPLYPMICLNREQNLSAEGAMKYIVLNIFASILLLYGFSILYSFNHSFFLSDLPSVPAVYPIPSLLRIGIVLIVVAFGLKLGSVPFHFWMPDVYESAPLSVVSFLAAAPKLAVLSVGLRLMQYHSSIWEPLLLTLGLLSLVVGNFMALIQTNIKRLLAYSSVGHLGFVLLGLFFLYQGCTPALFYSINYSLMISAMFGILAWQIRHGGKTEFLNDLKGLHIKNSKAAFGILIILITMAGLPPFVGFFAKLGLLELSVKHHLYPIAFIMVIMNVISSYYYWNIIRLIYFETAETGSVISLRKFDYVLVGILFLHILALLLLGIFPDKLIQYCERAITLSLIH